MTWSFATNEVHKIYIDFVKEIENGSEDFKPLKILHHFSSGLKAFYTWQIYNSIGVLREACGGAGFSAFSGLPYCRIRSMDHKLLMKEITQ